MTLINASSLSKAYGAQDVFLDLSLSIPPQARIALVGPNGIGKTTLLRILSGREQPSAGTLRRARNLRIGYLAQERGGWEPDAQAETQRHTLWEECLSAFEALRAMEADLKALEARLSRKDGDPQETEEVLAAYGRLQVEFDQRGGYTYPLQMRMVLSGLGFGEDAWQQPIHQLSSGQQTRAVLARLLLSNPDLLILDEPTNHLDIQAVEWLETYLSQWQGAALIVSHDRYFIDKACNMIWEMNAQRIEVYRGNYTAYLQQREERWRRRQMTFEAEKERLEKEIDYIRRNIAGQNTVQAKGKLRRLSRTIEAIEQLGFDAVRQRQWADLSQDVNTAMSMMSVDEAQRRLHALRDPSAQAYVPKMTLSLRSWQRSGNIVLRTRDLLVGYAGRPLFRAPDLELLRLECAAVIGANGTGKTTFLKTILEELEPLHGEVELGASLRVGYFAQTHNSLVPENTLMQEIESVSPSLLPEQIRKHLGRYLFSGDEALKQVKTLSGGERSRLALAKLALEDANLLLLDAPTNHLDIPAQEVLQSVLAEFEGTVILVSHDRYLIDRLATQIWEILPNGADVPQRLEVFTSTYSEYRAAAQAKAARQSELALEKAARQEISAQKSAKNRAQAQERRRVARLDELERKIAVLETRLHELVQQLENPPAEYAVVQQLGEEYIQCQQELDDVYREWEILQ